MISSFFQPGTSYSKNDKRRLLYENFFAYIGYSVCGALGNYQAKLSKTKHMEKTKINPNEKFTTNSELARSCLCLMACSLNEILLN